MLFLSTACTSLTEQGREALNKGEYDKALSLYQRAARSEDSPEAIQGLKKAQQAWIGQKLIDVRLFRLGNNIGASEELLLKLINNENEWQVFPTGAAFNTQSEEIQLFSQRIHKKINQELESSNPMLAQLLFKKNTVILEKALSDNLSNLENKIYDSGKKFCFTQEKSLKSDEYFSFLWLKQTCGIWKISLNEKIFQSSVRFFSDIKINSKVSGSTSSVSDLIQKSIEAAFIESKWFDPQGKAVLKLNVSGKLTSDQSEKAVDRVKDYTVKIPYEEVFTRIKKTNKDDLSSFIDLVSAISGNPVDERITDNGNGTETVRRTKYRNEERSHHYKAVEMQAYKKFDGSLTAFLGNQEFSTELGGEHIFKEDRHNENFPDIGLIPNSPAFISDEQWIKSISPSWIQELTTELQSHWVNAFCGDFEKKNKLSQREQAHRCAFQITYSPPESLVQFYLKNWQISFADWKMLTESR